MLGHRFFQKGFWSRVLADEVLLGVRSSEVLAVASSS
jgi:hypothetical protein